MKSFVVALVCTVGALTYWVQAQPRVKPPVEPTVEDIGGGWIRFENQQVNLLFRRAGVQAIFYHPRGLSPENPEAVVLTLNGNGWSHRLDLPDEQSAKQLIEEISEEEFAI